MTTSLGVHRSRYYICPLSFWLCPALDAGFRMSIIISFLSPVSVISFILNFLLLSAVHRQSCCGPSDSSSLGNLYSFSFVSIVHDLSLFFIKASWTSFPSLWEFISVLENFPGFCPAPLVSFLWLILSVFSLSSGLRPPVCFMFDCFYFTTRG